MVTLDDFRSYGKDPDHTFDALWKKDPSGSLFWEYGKVLDHYLLESSGEEKAVEEAMGRYFNDVNIYLSNASYYILWCKNVSMPLSMSFYGSEDAEKYTNGMMIFTDMEKAQAMCHRLNANRDICRVVMLGDPMEATMRHSLFRLCLAFGMNDFAINPYYLDRENDSRLVAPFVHHVVCVMSPQEAYSLVDNEAVLPMIGYLMAAVDAETFGESFTATLPDSSIYVLKQNGMLVTLTQKDSVTGGDDKVYLPGFLTQESLMQFLARNNLPNLDCGVIQGSEFQSLSSNCDLVIEPNLLEICYGKD